VDEKGGIVSDNLTPRVRRAIFQVTGRDPTEDDMAPTGVACQLERELEDANAMVEKLEAAVRALHAELQGGKFSAIPVEDILEGRVTL
jgi:molybdopterin-biosynthesis enzyme MoeA-like protein